MEYPRNNVPICPPPIPTPSNTTPSPNTPIPTSLTPRAPPHPPLPVDCPQIKTKIPSTPMIAFKDRLRHISTPNYVKMSANELSEYLVMHFENIGKIKNVWFVF